MPVETAALAVVETRIDHHDKHLDRIDASLEKLIEVSIQLKEIVKNQEEKHADTAVSIKDLNRQVEEQRRLSDDRRSELIGMINDVERDGEKSNEKLELAITQLEGKMTTGFTELSNSITTKVAFVDRWKWIVVGAGGVIIFIVDKMHLLEHLFSVK